MRGHGLMASNLVKVSILINTESQLSLYGQKDKVNMPLLFRLINKINKNKQRKNLIIHGLTKIMILKIKILNKNDTLYMVRQLTEFIIFCLSFYNTRLKLIFTYGVYF